MNETDSTTSGCIENGGDRFSLSAHPFLRRIVERPLEATYIEIQDVRHKIIVSLAPRGERAGDIRILRTSGADVARHDIPALTAGATLCRPSGPNSFPLSLLVAQRGHWID